MTNEPPPSEPIELSGFEVERRLGAGGMAEVFLAKKRGAEGTFKQLVVKRILPEHSKSRRFRHMFVEEAQLATRLNHPNIVQVYEFSHNDDDLLLSMEFVDGVDLGQLLRAARKSDQRIPPWVAAFIVAEAAKGLHYAHERKDEGGLPLDIVHRDVSPQNILISKGGVVKIADFGIASANLFREETGILKGKFAYMSPEQARGDKVDRRSDVYALGVVLYELLVGASPYGNRKDDALAEAVRYGSIKRPSTVIPDLPAGLDAVVAKAVARRVEERHQTARDMSVELATALLDHRQLIDSSDVGVAIRDLIGDIAAAGGSGPQLEALTMAAFRKARTGADTSTGGTDAEIVPERTVKEVRHVAVVGLRLEGYESLERALGEAAAERTWKTIRGTLNDIAYKHGAVLSWGGRSRAHAVVGLTAKPGRAPVEAGLIAVDTHEFLDGHSQDLPCEVRASVGLIRGIASGIRDGAGHLDRHELLAPADYLARELGRHTPFGKTWVAGGVFRLVRREFRWSDGPAIALDDYDSHNVPERMRVYVLLRTLTPDERVAHIAANPTELVGREAEKADLHAAYHHAVHRSALSSPPPDVVKPKVKRRRESHRGELISRVVVGDMGIGKTALVEAFLHELPETTKVLRVECSPVNVELPYATVIELLRAMVEAPVEVAYEDALRLLHEVVHRESGGSQQAEALLPRLAELLSGTESALADEDAAARYHDEVVLGARVVVGAIASQFPLAIVIDGMQWADRVSLELLKKVLNHANPVPVLMLFLMRHDERVDPYLEGLIRIELGPMSPEEQVALVQARLGVSSGAADVCRELLPRVGGNPYFLVEMIEAMLERGALEIIEGETDSVLKRNDRFRDPLETLPTTIEQIIANRLGELPSPEHDIVDWLAVAGGPLSDDDLVALSRLTGDDPITRLCARGLCDRKGRAIDFRHPIARDVAYNLLDTVRRARMHRRLGEYLEATPLARGLSAAIVAQHFERGETPQRAAQLFAEAAKAAKRAHQTELAIRYAERTLALLPPGDSGRLTTHASLELLYRHSGQSRERRSHLRQLRRLARESEQGSWIALALVRTAKLDLDEGAMMKGLPVAQRAADIARHARLPELEVEALIILCELLRDLGDVTGALSASERALKVTEASGVSRRARAEVLRAKGILLRRAGRLNAAVEAHAEAIVTFGAAADRRSEARARNALGFALFVLGRYEDSIAMCTASLALDREVGGRFKVAKTLANIGMAYARLGDTVEGDRFLKRAREAHERYDDQDGRVDTLLVLAHLKIEAGDLDEARLLAGDANALSAVSDNVYDRIHSLIVKALIARASLDNESAAALSSEARQLAEGQALVSYHVYATAIEGASRVALGETQSGVMLATNALGAVEAMEGSEYAVEIRALCTQAVILAQKTDVLTRSAPTLVRGVCRRALDEVDKVAGYIRSPRLRELFFQRAPVRAIVQSATEFVMTKRQPAP